jgi:hypothetical protein
VELEYGTKIFQFNSKCWNNTLSFNQSGEWLAFASHDSEMHFVKFTKEGVTSQAKPKSKRVVYRGNPILTGDFINENVYIGCGYD